MAGLFEKEVAGWREVFTRRGDTVEKIAARELGDAGLWYDLANLNNLLPPYITDNADEASSRVLLSGAAIKIPSSRRIASAETDPSEAFGSDVLLQRGEVLVERGDMMLVSGTTNLVQALRHVILTEPGELLYHQEYGCSIHTLMGQSLGPVNALIGRGFVERAVNADPRVSRVRRSTVSVNGDTLNIEMEAVAVDGREVAVRINGVST